MPVWLLDRALALWCSIFIFISKVALVNHDRRKERHKLVGMCPPAAAHRFFGCLWLFQDHHLAIHGRWTLWIMALQLIDKIHQIFYLVSISDYSVFFFFLQYSNFSSRPSLYKNKNETPNDNISKLLKLENNNNMTCFSQVQKEKMSHFLLTVNSCLTHTVHRTV